MQFLSALIRFREDIVSGVIWLAELDPFDFMLFTLLYAFLLTFILGMAVFYSI